MPEIKSKRSERLSPANSAALGQHLQSLRQAAGLSLQQLADAADVTKGAIYQYETGANAPALSTLLRLAAALGTSAGKLLDSIDPPKRNSRKS